MLQVLNTQKDGFIFCYKLIDGNNEYFAGLNNSYEIININCFSFEELIFRAIINKIIVLKIEKVTDCCNWKLQIEKFGFAYKDNKFSANLADLKLPKDCQKS